MKSWQFGLLYGQGMLVLSFVSKGVVSLVFLAVTLMVTVPAVIEGAAEVRR